MKYIIAENYLCFYALLEIILSDIGINVFTQYDLANEFGVVLPLGYSIANVYNVSFSSEMRDYGVHIDEQKFNVFFENYRISLKMSYISENPYIDYTYDKYSCFIPNGKEYYIYSFSYGSLYNEVKNYDVGHVSLLLNCLSSEQIQIYDPGPRSAGVKVIRRLSMHNAMEDFRGGVYVLEYTK